MLWSLFIIYGSLSVTSNIDYGSGREIIFFITHFVSFLPTYDLCLPLCWLVSERRFAVPIFKL